MFIDILDVILAFLSGISIFLLIFYIKRNKNEESQIIDADVEASFLITIIFLLLLIKQYLIALVLFIIITIAYLNWFNQTRIFIASQEQNLIIEHESIELMNQEETEKKEIKPQNYEKNKEIKRKKKNGNYGTSFSKF